MNTLLEILKEIYAIVVDNFSSLESRVSYYYMIPTLLIAFYVFKKTKESSSFLRYLFNKKTWLSKSARVDYALFLFNSVLKVLLIAPYLSFGFLYAFYVDDFLARTLGYERFQLNATETIILYTISITLLSDFTTFLLHYIMHKVPLLWSFHKIHHSATVLNPITQYRLHPVELILINIKETLVFGFCMGVFDYLSQHQVAPLTYLGVNVITMLFFMLGAGLRHSSVKFKFFNFLEYIFLSPYQHQIHHSNQEQYFDKNMGSKLAVWDYLFGTLLRSKEVKRVTFGINKKEDQAKKYESFVNNLILPFVDFVKGKNNLK